MINFCLSSQSTIAFNYQIRAYFYFPYWLFFKTITIYRFTTIKIIYYGTFSNFFFFLIYRWPWCPFFSDFPIDWAWERASEYEQVFKQFIFRLTYIGSQNKEKIVTWKFGETDLGLALVSAGYCHLTCKFLRISSLVNWGVCLVTSVSTK